MKYQKALRNKIDRIIKYVEEEVRIGKCNESDIQAIADAIRNEVEPYRRIATPAEIEYEIEMTILRGKEDPF